MQITIDTAGRLVLPESIRDRLGLTGGGLVDVVERDGRVELTPVLADLRLVERHDAVIATPTRPLPPLTDDMVRAALERTRR